MDGFFVGYVNDEGKGIAALTRDFDHLLLGAVRVDVGDGDFRAFSGKMPGDSAPDATSATGDDGDLVFQFMHDSSTKPMMDLRDKRKQLVQVLNSVDPRVLERLIIWPVGHEHDSVGVFGHITAVLVAIVDEQLDFKFPD